MEILHIEDKFFLSQLKIIISSHSFSLIENCGIVKMEEDKDFSYFFLFHEGEYAGGLAIKSGDELCRLHIEERFRRKRFATQLLLYTLEFLRSESYTEVFLIINESSLLFWHLFFTENNIKFNEISGNLNLVAFL